MKKQTKHFPFLAIQQQRFIFHFDNQSNVPNLPSPKQCYQWIWHAFKYNYRYANITLLLLNEAEACAYNRDYRGKDYATNVLSFALNEGEIVLPQNDPVLRGDLIICPQVVQREALEQGKPFIHHFAHLLIHGTLHLVGFDHIDEKEAAQMEALEVKLLAQLNIPNPYIA